MLQLDEAVTKQNDKQTKTKKKKKKKKKKKRKRQRQRKSQRQRKRKGNLFAVDKERAHTKKDGIFLLFSSFLTILEDCACRRRIAQLRPRQAERARPSRAAQKIGKKENCRKTQMKVLFLALVAMVGVGCKRHENEGSIKPGDSVCGAFGDCFSCTAQSECGWCGGAGCGPTSEGCYNKSRHLDEKEAVCRHPEDIFMTSASFCLDPCVGEGKCGSCLSLVLRPSLMSRSLRCGWAGQCVLGTNEGPLRNISVSTWRWTQHTQELQNPRLVDSFCAAYAPCGTATRCAECSNAFVSQTEGCVFCLDNETAVGSVGEGGGKCISERNAACFTGGIVAWNNSTEFCPAMPTDSPASTKAPMGKMNGAQRQLQVLILGVFGLLVIGLLLIVNKLNE